MIPLPDAFQPAPARPTTLHWRIFQPSPPSETPLPGVVVVHGGEFSHESPYDGFTSVAAQDIADAGYYVISIDHELAPCSLIPNQPCHNDNPDSGRPPQQTNDVKNATRALRADAEHCNGKIGIVGASSGGSHAVFVAVDKTPTPNDAWPHWFQDGHDDRPDCAVSLWPVPICPIAPRKIIPIRLSRRSRRE